METPEAAESSPAKARSARRGAQPDPLKSEGGSPRKIQLQRAYGTERARVVQPERGMFLTKYFFANWLPLLGHSAMTTVLAARSLCYWNPINGELRNTVETDMSELARRPRSACARSRMCSTTSWSSATSCATKSAAS